MGAISTKGAESLLEAKLHRFAYCWELKRTDNTTFRFTDHDHNLTLLDGTTYVPVGGFTASAKQRQAGLKDNNVEVVGMFDATAITYDDLRAGKYRDAKITERLVDWMYPWAGAFLTNVWWISSTQYVNNTWKAQLKGWSLWLSKSVGNLCQRNCRYKLGDAKCTKNLTSFTHTGTVNTITSPLIKFTTTGAAAGQVNGYFDYGDLTWTSGPNAGLVSEVRKFQNSSGTFALQLRTPFAIANGDTFSAVAGCDKTPGTCKTKYGNLVNYGGEPHIPGNDKLMQSPQTINVD
jgi:uncharacterized phage protein (TIGR02218 family)